MLTRKTSLAWIVGSIVAVSLMAGCADDDDGGNGEDYDDTASGGATVGAKGSPGIGTPLAVLAGLAGIGLVALRRNK